MGMVVHIDRAVISSVYLSPAKEQYPEKLYCDLLTADGTLRVLVQGMTQAQLEGLSLEPVKIVSRLVSRRFGNNQQLQLDHPTISRIIPEQPAQKAAS